MAFIFIWSLVGHGIVQRLKVYAIVKGVDKHRLSCAGPAQDEKVVHFSRIKVHEQLAKVFRVVFRILEPGLIDSAPEHRVRRGEAGAGAVYVRIGESMALETPTARTCPLWPTRAEAMLPRAGNPDDSWAGRRRHGSRPAEFALVQALDQTLAFKFLPILDNVDNHGFSPMVFLICAFSRFFASPMPTTRTEYKAPLWPSSSLFCVDRMRIEVEGSTGYPVRIRGRKVRRSRCRQSLLTN